MPVYEYVCIECKERTEVRATFAEKEKGLKVVCPKCGSKKMAQVFGTFMTIRSSNGGSNLSGCGPLSGPGCCG